jgi:hypothetical protein
MFTSREGITNRLHLVKIIQSKSSLKVDEKIVEGIVDRHLEKSQEIYKDGILAGYLLLFNFAGARSFHAYKLIEGHTVRAFRLAKEFIKKI